MRVKALLLVIVLVLAGCGGPGTPGDAARIDPELVAELAPGDARTVGQSVDEFAFELFDQVDDKRQNTVTSPLSITVLLAMLLAGADGATADEIADVLHLRERRDVRVGALLRELAATDDVTLSVADSLWAGQGVPLQKDYLTFARKAFGATAEQRDLGSPETAEEIDAWAAENTNGRIDKIAADLGLPDPQAVMVLLNAVYFLGEWKTEFDPAATRPARFGAIGDVPTMHKSNATFGYAERDGYRMLRLPYGEDGRYGMEIMLPDEGEQMPRLDGAEWRTAVDSIEEERIDEVALPKFELRWKGELTDQLKQLGMPTAFAPGQADFRPLSPQATALSKVVQKTYIRVDEKGTEAAAVSGGAMATSAQVGRRVFRVDRPFMFTISDRPTGTILFLGSVTDPRG
ncbi:serpin family protein [Actinoplanes sp. NPDC051470]|uniref:serpin family protein n=1 Tax=Actinoplanes sp. NPDC051470 TaxID=3157224 RepID=UPI003427CB8F